ncbi:unnamed protein product, partial [Vitis vinifera]
MGSFLSLAGPKSRTSEHDEGSQHETCKRQRMSSSFNEENPRLIPSLPDEISILILARLPRICYFDLRLVSRNWKATITSPELFNLRKELGKTEEWLYILTKVEEDRLLWHALDPLSRRWQRLPSMPNDTLDQMPFCGCAIGAVDGCLYVLGGFSSASTMRCVWRFDPILNAWSEVTPMSTGRAYCKTEDAWKVVIGKVPICDFTDSESPYLLAGFHGKLHIITKDANHDIAVLQADLRDNLGFPPSTSPSFVWKVIATRDFGTAELVSCQVLDI